VFEDHFMKWYTTLIGQKAIDHHFHAISRKVFHQLCNGPAKNIKRCKWFF
jgi:hypothetical protein